MRRVHRTLLALSLLAASCDHAHDTAAAADAPMLVAVILDGDVDPASVDKLDVDVLIPGGIMSNEKVAFSKDVYRGVPAPVSVDLGDADGDGGEDVIIHFDSDPFANAEISFQLTGTLARPFRISAKASRGAATLARGMATADTGGHEIAFVPGRNPVIEVHLACAAPGGCRGADAGVGRDGR